MVWLDWYLAKLAAVSGSTVHDLPTAAAQLRTERDLTFHLLADWDLHVLPPGPPAVLLQTALAAIEPTLPLPPT